MCVALAALDAIVHVSPEAEANARSSSSISTVCPAADPDHETTLQAGELITAVELPPLPHGTRSTYRKIRDRASYAFALVSAAAAMQVAGDGSIAEIRLALGGVAHKPWRAWRAEAILRQAVPSEANFRRAADAELADAAGLRDNGFKIELARRVIVSTLGELAEGSRS